eukprot:m.311210 g.311210  ORF g.311210 m.311210 type:complete len:105 (+) comp62052_c0_seq1:2-316(+)
MLKFMATDKNRKGKSWYDVSKISDLVRFIRNRFIHVQDDFSEHRDLSGSSSPKDRVKWNCCKSSKKLWDVYENEESEDDKRVLRYFLGVFPDLLAEVQYCISMV